MRIKQIFWSSPVMNRLSIRYNGGWMEKKYNLMGQCLSCLLLKQLYPQVDLITDDAGKRLLVDRLQLPYDEVTTDLNAMPPYHDDLWSAAKLYAYSLQKEPFLHVDGDLFLYKRPGIDKEDSPVVVQANVGFDEGHYNYLLNCIQRFSLISGSNYPKPVGTRNPRGYAFGIFGGNDTGFISEFAKAGLSFFNRNIDLINKAMIFISGDSVIPSNDLQAFTHINLMLESYFLHQFTQRTAREITSLFEDLFSFPPVSDRFLGKNAKQSYLYPLYNKKDPLFCRQLEFRLRNDFPDYYYSITSATQEFIV